MSMTSTVKKEGVNVVKWGLVIGIAVAVFVPLVQWAVTAVKSKFSKAPTA